jgi:murein DD-endopeptidase / murein LD-carboxypeptidase
MRHCRFAIPILAADNTARVRNYLMVVVAGLACSILTGCQSPATHRITRLPDSHRAPSRTASQAFATRSPAPSAPVRQDRAALWRNEASQWLGVPHRLGGNSRSGIDCSGLVVELYRSVAGLQLPRTSAQQFQVGRPVAIAELRAGDLLFFQTTAEPISHVGIWVGQNQFVHASTSRGVIFSTLTEPYYAQRFRGAKRPSETR